MRQKDVEIEVERLVSDIRRASKGLGVQILAKFLIRERNAHRKEVLRLKHVIRKASLRFAVHHGYDEKITSIRLEMEDAISARRFKR